MKSTVVIINGYPQSGKDTFALAVLAELYQFGIFGSNISSITCVKNMLDWAGIPTGAKGPLERKLLADVKTALDGYHASATNLACKDVIQALYQADIVFLHIREPKAIALSKSILQDHAKVVTLFVDKPDANRAAGNHADEGVQDFEYDDTITNDGSLEDLKAQAVVYAKQFL